MMFALPIFDGPRARAFTFDAHDPYFNPFEQEPAELIRLIESKEPRAIGSWRELGGEEYARAFTAARTMGHDIVHDLHEAFLATLREPGGTAKDFAARMAPIMREKGWLLDKSEPQRQTRLHLIYDTNLRVGQAVGRWERIQRTKLALPYLAGFTARDSRVRHGRESDHRAFEGILLPVDHPFWLAYFPPLGFRCRCQVVQRSRSQVARAGQSVTSESDLAERTARLGLPWGFNPGVRPLAMAEAAADRANSRRLEGAPPIEPAREAQLGRAIWNTIAGRALNEAVESILARIFA